MTFLPAEQCKHNKNFRSNTWYSNTWMCSQDIKKWWYRVTVGAGGFGKTYSGRKLVLKNFKNKKRCFVWLRLTNQAVDNLLQNGAMGLFPKSLLNKYGLELSTKGNFIYLNGELAGIVASIQGYYNNKGQEMELPDYSLKHSMKEAGELIGAFDIIADELIREESEKKTFDIKKAFQNQIENVVRRRKGIRVFIYANYLTEIRDVEELFDIQLVSGKFGIYKNIKTHTVIEYLDSATAWKESQKQTYAGVLNINGGRFANKTVEENKLIVYDNELRGAVIKFNIKIGPIYYVVKQLKDNYIICNSRGNDNSKPKYALLPIFMTTKEMNYDAEIRSLLSELFQQGKLQFTSTSIYLDFTKHMKTT